MRFGETAREAPSGPDLEAIGAALDSDGPPGVVRGRRQGAFAAGWRPGQGVALTFGEGSGRVDD